MSFFSKDSAYELEQQIIRARSTVNPWFELRLELIVDSHPVKTLSVTAREVRPAQRLKDTSELVHCVTATGRKVEIFFPPINERQIGIAEILIEDDSELPSDD